MTKIYVDTKTIIVNLLKEDKKNDNCNNKKFSEIRYCIM